MTAIECLNHEWLKCSLDTHATSSDHSSTSITVRLGQDVKTPSIILETTTSQSSQNNSSTTSTNSILYDNHICDTTNSIPIISTTIPESITCNFSTTTVKTLLPSSSFSKQTAQHLKDDVLTTSVYFKNKTSHCNNKENLSCNVKLYAIGYQTPDSTTNKSMQTQLHPTLPKVHTTPNTPHIFPDAPTTPKVSRKSQPESPPSVKALVKKFQLAAPECKPAATSDSPSAVIAQVSRKPEFTVELSSTTSDSVDVVPNPLNNQCKPPSSSETVSTPTSSTLPTVNRKSFIVKHGKLC